MSYSSEEISEEQLAILADLEMLREDLVAELQAINQYEDHMLNLENEGAVTALERIIEDEKEHVAELLKAIQNLEEEKEAVGILRGQDRLFPGRDLHHHTGCHLSKNRCRTARERRMWQGYAVMTHTRG
jgi:rubrerythrin